ncbi:MmgE/PrpD family protein [Amycolatopsis sp. 3B14]|uniref:MmgE/PrpD family protein n=1 Tax=Amycolatopsis sp. 3B14 TaxID=3243600 RepID=UPI003D9578FD
MIADDLGAFHAEPSRAARRLARALRPGPSTVLGATDTTTADVAAFVDGTMVRHPDFNDGYLGLEPGHPSDNIPARPPRLRRAARARGPRRPRRHGTPMTGAQFEEKFLALVEPLATAAWCSRVLDAIWHVESAPSVTALTQALVLVRPPSTREIP